MHIKNRLTDLILYIKNYGNIIISINLVNKHNFHIQIIVFRLIVFEIRWMSPSTVLCVTNTHLSSFPL